MTRLLKLVLVKTGESDLRTALQVLNFLDKSQQFQGSPISVRGDIHKAGRARKPAAAPARRRDNSGAPLSKEDFKVAVCRGNLAEVQSFVERGMFKVILSRGNLAKVESCGILSTMSMLRWPYCQDIFGCNLFLMILILISDN